jgi:hypothetical protein
MAWSLVRKVLPGSPCSAVNKKRAQLESLLCLTFEMSIIIIIIIIILSPDLNGFLVLVMSTPGRSSGMLRMISGGL